MHLMSLALGASGSTRPSDGGAGPAVLDSAAARERDTTGTPSPLSRKPVHVRRGRRRGTLLAAAAWVVAVGAATAEASSFGCADAGAETYVTVPGCGTAPADASLASLGDGLTSCAAGAGGAAVDPATGDVPLSCELVQPAGEPAFYALVFSGTAANATRRQAATNALVALFAGYTTVPDGGPGASASVVLGGRVIVSQASCANAVSVLHDAAASVAGGDFAGCERTTPTTTQTTTVTTTATTSATTTSTTTPTTTSTTTATTTQTTTATTTPAYGRFACDQPGGMLAVDPSANCSSQAGIVSTVVQGCLGLNPRFACSASRHLVADPAFCGASVQLLAETLWRYSRETVRPGLACGAGGVVVHSDGGASCDADTIDLVNGVVTSYVDGTFADCVLTTPTTTATTTRTTTATTTATSTAMTTATTTATTTVTTTATTHSPTAAPTGTPTVSPTFAPTATPTFAPTAVPTATPTADPTFTPTATPTFSPTATPTTVPTAAPTFAPTALFLGVNRLQLFELSELNCSWLVM